MNGNPYDVILDDYPYEKMTYAMLQDKAAMGDERAAAELDRRATVHVLGPEALDTSPVETASDDTLLARFGAGDKEAQAEYERRNGLR